jgi:hypothetical protein
MEMLVVINALRRPSRTRTFGSYAEDSYYQSHARTNPSLLPLVSLASFAAVIALGIDLWRY